MVLVDIDISAGDQDGNVNRFAYTYVIDYGGTTGGQLEMFFGSAGNQQRAFLGFGGITIPQGSTIDDATLNLSVLSNDGGTKTMTIHASNTNNPALPNTTTGGQKVFTASKIGATVQTTGITQTTATPIAVDVQSMVQELVDNFDYNNERMLFSASTTTNRPVILGDASAEPASNLTINYTGPIAPKDFTIDALLKALGANGTCEEEEKDVIYDNLTPVFNTFDRIGGPLSTIGGPPLGGSPNPVTRIGWRIDGPTLVGKDIKLIRVSRMRSIDGQPSGNLFMTVRDKKDKIRVISNIINANTIPISPPISINFTFERTIKLQEDDKILMEFDNCLSCPGGFGPVDVSTLWGASTSLTIPTGMVGVRYFQGWWQLINGTQGTVGYVERSSPGNYAKFDFSADPSFIDSAQRGCFSIDVILKKTNNEGFALHTDDMSDAGNWVTSDITNIDVSGGVINWAALKDGTNDTISQFFADTTIPRLGSPVDVKGWTTRCKVTFNTVGLGSNDNSFYISVSNRDRSINATDITPSQNGAEDSLGWKFSVGSGGQKIIGYSKIQSIVGVGSGFPPEEIVEMNTALATGTFFLEFERINRTLGAWRIYTDSSYTTLVEEKQGPIDPRIIGIRVGSTGARGMLYFKAGNDGNFAASAESLDGIIDDFSLRQNRTDGLAGNTTVTGADGTFGHRIDIKINQIFGTGGAGFQIDSILLKTQVKPFTVDANILFARAVGIDAKLAVPIDITSVLFTTPEPVIPLDTFIVDAILVGTKKPFTVDALLIIVPSRLTLVDAFIQKELTKPFIVDAVLRAQQTKIPTVDAILQAFGLVELFEVDGCISLSTVVESFSVDSILIVSPSELSLVDSLLSLEPMEFTCADAILQASGANGACPAGGEVLSTVLDNIDSFDTQVNTTQSFFKIGQRWTPTTNEVALLEKGITKVTLWHGHTGGSGEFNTFVWQNATTGTSSETIIRDGGTFFFFGSSSGINKRTRTLFDATGTFTEIWLPTAGVEYVIGIEEDFPGTAQTRKTSGNTINGNFTTRASAGVWTNTAGEDWTLQLTIEQSGLGQGNGNFCLGVDGRLQLIPTHQFTIDAILVVTNTQNFTVDARLFLSQALGFTTDALLDIPGADTKNFTVDSIIKGIESETFEVDAVLTPSFVTLDFAVNAIVNFHQSFVVDVSVAQDTGLVRDIGDLIVRVLFEDDDLGGSGLTGRQVVDNIVAITTVELQWGFTGKNSRIRSWLNTLKFRGVVQEDGSDPDWYETIWTLV